jgi:hypothetical protein
MSIEWKPARYEDGWWAELPGNRSAWIYRPSQGRPLRPLDYFLGSVHFSDEPLRRCWARVTADDPELFLPEATRFLQSKNLIPTDSASASPEATSVIQPPLV